MHGRLLAEGDNTPADVVMTADAANIELSAEAGALAAVQSDVLTDTIPEELRSAADERDVLYETVFLPVVDTLQPIE